MSELADLLNRIWSLLSSGANAGAARSPFSMLQAATVGLDGAPKARTIVLREVKKDEASLTFHTDARSEKVSELRKDSRIALTGCDLDAGIQIRAEGVARIVDSVDERRAFWSASRPRSLIVYRAPLVPGTVIRLPQDAHAIAGQEEVDPSAGFENFCLVTVEVSRLDYLDLSPNGHVRARFVRENGTWHGSWVAP
ncbi:MAG TPA: pyridoxamine 5'-phosphate oxidase family protein [Paraburkholderia sp.]